MDQGRDQLEERIRELEARLATQATESDYYRRMAALAGKERLREAEAHSRLVARLEDKIRLIEAQHQRLQHLHREIERIGATDELTQTLSRRGFITQFQQILQQEREMPAPEGEGPRSLCVLIDVVALERINDDYGRSAGDELLSSLGTFLKQSRCLLEADIVGRYGGGELILVLAGRGAAEARETAERLVEQIERHRFRITLDTRIRIQVRLGLSPVQSGDSTVFSVIDRAYESLRQAKREARRQPPSRLAEHSLDPHP